MQTANVLLANVLDDLRNRRVNVVQALLEDPSIDGISLRECGLKQVGDLAYLVCVASHFPQIAPPSSLVFKAYAPRWHQRLARVIERTYEGSLDCPAADGIRAIEDVLEGYRGAGPFNPEHWLIAVERGTDVGCVILADDPTKTQSELLYMGIVPESRGRGLGAELVRQALWLARSSGCKRMALAVDVANEPAIAIYELCGFIRWNRRSVFLGAL